jgi:hypothetical protein
LDCNIDEAVSYSENISIFGDRSAYMINLGRGRGVSEENLDVLTEKFLESLDKSEHFFVMVGSGAEFEKKIESEGKSLKLKVQKIEEKKVFDFPAELVASLQKHDKKNSWNLLLKELEGKEAEPTHGSCVFAYKSLLTYMNDTKKNSPNSGVKDFSWKQAASNAKLGKREKKEVVDKYFNLVLAYHHARMGDGNLDTQLEKWVLEN